MEVALIVYGVFATLVVVFCTVSRVGPRVQYICISMATLKDLGRTPEDPVVVNVGISEYPVVSEALRVPAEELKGFLRWVPPPQHPGPLRVERRKDLPKGDRDEFAPAGHPVCVFRS